MTAGRDCVSITGNPDTLENKEDFNKTSASEQASRSLLALIKNDLMLTGWQPPPAANGNDLREIHKAV